MPNKITIIFDINNRQTQKIFDLPDPQGEGCLMHVYLRHCWWIVQSKMEFIVRMNKIKH